MKRSTGLALCSLAVLMALACAPAAYAQRWEVGGGGGVSFYTPQTISNPAGSVTASFKPGFALTGFVAQAGNRYGGELRYVYHQSDMKLEGLSKSFTFGGRSQTFSYDFMILAGSRESKVRPYASVGGGMKQYEGTGSDMAVQPLGNVAVLTRTSQWKPVFTGGAGVRIQTSARTVLRAEVKAYLTQNPKEVITPVAASGGDAWIVNFLPVFSIAFVF
jgi:hypothetical protein